MSAACRSIHTAGSGEARLIVGDHPSMRRLAEVVRRAAPLDTPVIVHGPTGAGKEHVAESLHRLSGRRGALVPVNVASLSESIADSELFGAMRGAYTGASADRPGLIAAAAEGTLLLDEAADLPVLVQAKLLRALDNGTLRPVGAATDRRVRFRLVLCIQDSAQELVASGRWRPDFYYRVAGLVVRVPPLAERVSDIPLLVQYFAAQHGLPIQADADWERVMHYSWPGNVRQLRRAVDRAVFQAPGEPVEPVAILEALADDLVVAGSGVERQCVPPTTLRDAERNHIATMLAQTAGDVAAAAMLLGLSRSQLYRKLQRFGLRGTQRC